MKMKLAPTILLVVTSAISAVAEPCQYFAGKNVMDVSGAINFRFYHDNPDHWTWSADQGDAVIQDDGWVYFDGNSYTRTSTMRIAYNNGQTALVQPPNGHNGWCSLPAGAQNNIKSVIGWDS